MQRTRFSILAGVLCLFTVAACTENPNSVKLFSGRPLLVLTPTQTLDQSIDQLLALFPKDLGARDEQRIQQGQNEDLNPRATWNSIKRKYAAGASNPAQLTAAKKELFRLSDWVTRNAQEMNTPPGGETKIAAAARLVLYMSMYVYGGPDTPPPSYTPGADATVGVVTPNAPATIVTPTLHAGVQLESGSVAENTVIVVTQNPTPYPENCSGPLQTKLCQYPQFYTFDMFPHKRLLKAAKFNVCHVNSGESRYPLADHDRFRLAHAKPADPANYTPGSTIRDQNGESIEILPLVAQTFSTCTNNVYANNSLGGPLGVMSRFARGLRNLVSPRTAYAIDVGLGGLSFDTSPFNDVDPLGRPDRAVQSVSVAPSSPHAGDSVAVRFTVANIGTATGSLVPATIRLTSANVIAGPPPVDQILAETAIPVLVPGGTAMSSVDAVIPGTVIPGTYNISLELGDDATFPDANLSNNSGSVVLIVAASSRPGLVSWWPANGSASDGKDGNGGTLVNGATFAAGKFGQAFLLDGIDDYVDVGNASNLHVSGGDFTIDAWVMFNGIGGDMSIMDKMSVSGVNTDGWRLLKQSDNRFWFCFGGGSGNQCWNSSYTIFSTTVATRSAWYHVAVVKNSTTFSLYVNGILEDTRSPIPAFVDTHSANLRLGSYTLEGSHLNGEIDEAEIYNRALSATEILAIYNR